MCEVRTPIHLVTREGLEIVRHYPYCTIVLKPKSLTVLGLFGEELYRLELTSSDNTFLSLLPYARVPEDG